MDALLKAALGRSHQRSMSAKGLQARGEMSLRPATLPLMHIAANGTSRPANCSDFILTDQQAFSTERGQLPELLHSLGPLRTLVTTAANGNKEPRAAVWLKCSIRYFGRGPVETASDLDKLVAELRLSQGGLRVEPGHFHSWSVEARFYAVLYLLTRMTEARDWGTGLPLKSSLLGKMNKLEVHHIFARSRLYKANFERAEVNALGNFCFLTKDTNLRISDRRPEDYFPEIEEKHPGALASQWIPNDPALWRIEAYRDFLEARKVLLAKAANICLATLLHDEKDLLGEGKAARLTMGLL